MWRANATSRSCRLREYLGCWVERGASCMESAVWRYYWGCWLEHGARCACHARKERTDMDVYDRNTNCVASLVGVQISVISKEMKFILGRLHEIHLLLFSFGFAFLYCNNVGFFFGGGFWRWIWKSQFILCNCFFCKYISFSPYISLCLYRYFANELRNSCLFEI
jgi:hypothetical protein